MEESATRIELSRGILLEFAAVTSQNPTAQHRDSRNVCAPQRRAGNVGREWQYVEEFNEAIRMIKGVYVDNFGNQDLGRDAMD